MDLDPSLPVGIDEPTMRFIDVFLLHCLLTESPPDTPREIAALARNQLRAAGRGREPGLMLERGEAQVALREWGAELVDQCAPAAAALDATHGGSLYRDALASAQRVLADSDLAPSARVLATTARDFDGSYVAFTRALSAQTKNRLLAMPFPGELATRFAALAEASVAEQKRIEDGDSMPFEIYRQAYLSPDRLGL